jgi:hypothetical protein
MGEHAFVYTLHITAYAQIRTHTHSHTHTYTHTHIHTHTHNSHAPCVALPASTVVCPAFETQAFWGARVLEGEGGVQEEPNLECPYGA